MNDGRRKYWMDVVLLISINASYLIKTTRLIKTKNINVTVI